MITVIDSCTWIDAMVAGGVEEAAITRAFSLGVIAGCDSLWNENEWVLTRKYDFPPKLVAEDLALYRMFSVNVSIDGSVRGCTDPDDDFILECAVRSGARVIVSNDRKHLVSMRSYEFIPILTPEQFLFTPYAVAGDDVVREYALLFGTL